MWQQPTPGIRAGAESESGLSECRKKAKPPDFRRAARYKMWQRPTPRIRAGAESESGFSECCKKAKPLLDYSMQGLAIRCGSDLLSHVLP